MGGVPGPGGVPGGPGGPPGGEPSARGGIPRPPRSPGGGVPRFRFPRNFSDQINSFPHSTSSPLCIHIRGFHSASPRCVFTYAIRGVRALAFCLAAGCAAAKGGLGEFWSSNPNHLNLNLVVLFDLCRILDASTYRILKRLPSALRAFGTSCTAIPRFPQARKRFPAEMSFSPDPSPLPLFDLGGGPGGPEGGVPGGPPKKGQKGPFLGPPWGGPGGGPPQKGPKKGQKRAQKGGQKRGVFCTHFNQAWKLARELHYNSLRKI